MNGRIKRAEEEPRLAFPLIGKIKCGKKDDRGFPMSVDYFIPSGKYSGYFGDAYGEKPNVLQVVFMHDDPKLVCDEKYEIRNKAGQLVASGDGLDFKVFDPATDNYKPYTLEDYPDLLERVAAKCGGEWKTTLTLRFLIPKISGIVGHWELRTAAKSSSIPDIIAVFDSILAEKGFIKGIIFDLHVAIHKSNKPGSKSRYPVLTLVPNHSKENIELIKSNLLGNDPDLQGKRIG